MTSRFVRLGIAKQVTVIAILSLLPTLLFPLTAAAQTKQNKQGLVFEINKFITTRIPDLTDKNQNKPAEVTPEIPAPVKPTPVEQKTVAPKSKNALPTKSTPENRVYMQEPEIRAYLCPKLGDKCNIFIAILKAENGTHECTRDNRGLNKNGSVDIGLSQINWTSKSPYTFEQLQDCKFNLDIALKKIETRGFQPWYAYTKGSYKKHLPAVLASAKVIAEAALVKPNTN